jgi:hypothetical protein
LTNNKENRFAKISTAGFFIEIDYYIVVAKLLKIVGFKTNYGFGQIILI